MLKVKLTPAQAALFHLIESLIASIVLTVIVGAVQYISVHGLNWPGLEATAVSAFLGALSMAYKSVSSNPNTGQAVLDTVGEVKQIAPGIDVSALALQLAQEVAKIRMSDVQPGGAGQRVPALQQQGPGPQPIVFPPAPRLQSFDLATQQTGVVSAPPFPLSPGPGQQQQSGRGG